VTNTEDPIRFKLETDSSAFVFLEPRIYSKEAVLRACYWYTNVAFIQIIPSSSSDGLIVHVSLKQAHPTLENPEPIKIADLIGDFCNSLLDFELRRQVEAETAGVRQLILAKAFSESGVLEDEPPGTIADPVEEKQPSSLVQVMNRSDR
jgi:His-Xaa-Ser system protein HxsD